MCPRLPVDLYPDLAFNPLAINDHLPDHQTQHLLALCIGRRGRSPERWEIAAQGHNSLSICLSESPKATGSPRLVLFLHGFHCAELLFPLPLQRASHQTGFLAPLPDTGALLAWPDSVRVPGGVPTACSQLAPPVPIAPRQRARASADLAAVLPGTVASTCLSRAIARTPWQSVPPNWLWSALHTYTGNSPCGPE